MVRTSRSKNTTAVAVRCDGVAGMPREANSPDPLRDLAIDIVEIFAALLREEEMHDAFVEVYGRLVGRWSELQRK